MQNKSSRTKLIILKNTIKIHNVCEIVNGNRAIIEEEPFLVYVNFIFFLGQIINIIVIKLRSTLDS